MIEENYVEPRKKPNVLVTGTPGVGKTTFCKLLTEYVPDLQYISVGEIVNNEKLYKKWDDKFDCPIYDPDMVCDYLEAIHAPGGYVVEFHSPEIFPERWFDCVVLLRCNNTALFDRLKGRGYSESKITENLECEILEVTADTTKESYSENIILELRSDSEEDVEKNITATIEWLKNWSAQRNQ